MTAAGMPDSSPQAGRAATGSRAGVPLASAGADCPRVASALTRLAGLAFVVGWVAAPVWVLVVGRWAP